MNYWYLMTQNCVYPKDPSQTSYFDRLQTVIVVTKEDVMPNKLLKDTNWIGTNENDEGDTKVTTLMGWSQLR